MLTCCKERVLVCYLENHSQMGGKLNRMGFGGGQLGRMAYIQYMPLYTHKHTYRNNTPVLKATLELQS